MKLFSLLFSFFTVLFLSYQSFALPVTSCYSTKDFLIKKAFEKDKSNKYGVNHKLYVSFKNSHAKWTLSGNIVLEDNKSKGIEYKNDNVSFFMPSDKQNTIIYEDKTVTLKKMDCMEFLAEYDSVFIDGKRMSYLTAGKNFMTSKNFQDNSSSYSPSFDCTVAEKAIEKAICSNKETAFLDKYFMSLSSCIMKRAQAMENGEAAAKNIQLLTDAFIKSRDKAYKSKNGTFTKSELSAVKKSYMLGTVFLPMIIAANDGDIEILGRNLFFSYYMLANQGVSFQQNLQKGLKRSDIIRDIFKDRYDEIMFYYSAVYDNMNSRLQNLFYYTVYLTEKYGFSLSDGSFVCE